MFVNMILFLVSVSCNIDLITIDNAPQCHASKLGYLIHWIIQTHACTGFAVQTLLMDNEFEKVQDHVPMLNFNTTVADVGEAERRIRVIKDRAHGFVCTLPYPHLPHQMLIHLLHFVVM